MAERRTLVEGLDTIETAERSVEEGFVYGKKGSRVVADTPAANPTDKQPITAPEIAASRPLGKTAINPLTGVGRVPVGARIRTELATALKRASLERQLHGIEPNSLQDILEEALAPWLRQHGYLE